MARCKQFIKVINSWKWKKEYWSCKYKICLHISH